MNDDAPSHTEAVLAFIHEAKTWKDMDTDERLEWCRRAAHVISDESNETFGEWTQTALAPVLGIGRQVLGQRLAWSEDYGRGDHRQAVKPGGRKVHQRASDARRFLTDPAIIGERKAEIVVEALSDDYVAAQVAARIGSDPNLLARIERVRRYSDRVEPSEPAAAVPVDEAWSRWLSRLNSVLMEGARLADRMEAEQVDPGVVPQVALFAYQLITEKRLDAELRHIYESQGVR